MRAVACQEATIEGALGASSSVTVSVLAKRVARDARSPALGRALLRPERRGFTLVEVMVVVVIAGILAIVGVTALNKHLMASRGIEALAMIQSIRSAQEAHRALNGTYLDVSRAGWFPRDPSQNGVGKFKTTFYSTSGEGGHADNARWLELNPTVSGPVLAGYRTNAGLPGEAMTEPARSVESLQWPDATEPWYVIQAIADTNGDGSVAFFLASSLNGEVYRSGEYEGG